MYVLHQCYLRNHISFQLLVQMNFFFCQCLDVEQHISHVLYTGCHAVHRAINKHNSNNNT